ncbi:MAG TPA: rod shape-determining protein MreC [Gemmatimonadales bacterium]|nr:rod shape-determining protein MreC [Gemmatimonadales bacterium]
MAPGSDRSLSRRDNALFVLCVALSVVMLVRPDWGNLVTGMVRQSVLRPFLWMQQRAEESRTSRAAFERLRAERDSAAYAAQFLPSLRSENQRLRDLLGLGKRLTIPYIPAEVLHQSLPTDGRTLILSAGEKQGVQPFDAVVSAEGLIGVVRFVEPERSLALTWAHPEFRASAFTQPGQVFGVIGPAVQITGSEQLLQLKGVAIRDSVPIGTLVTTSGLGGVYPTGIPVGTVFGQATEETGWERIYLVRPAANPEEASQVLILRNPKNLPVGKAFSPDSGQ